MSWNKNTIQMIDLEWQASLLKCGGAKDIELVKLGEFQGNGLNDDYSDNGGIYPLYRLYINQPDGKTQILQNIVRLTHDCDSDDVIDVVVFNDREEAKKHPKFIWMDCADFDCKIPEHPKYYS